MTSLSHNLSAEELVRYARQLGPGVLTEEGQSRLRSSAALVSRIGGMGGPAALDLVMAGVGRLIFAHGGRLESPDLNRMLLGSEDALGQPRAVFFAQRLQGMNHFVEVEAIDHELADDEALALAQRVQVVISSAPTFAERLRLNRAAIAGRVPLIDAAQWGMTGTLIVVDPGRTACLECLYPEPPPFEEFFPVVGALPTMMGGMAALEAIKILSGCGRPMFGQLFMFDGYQGRFSTVQLQRNPRCRCCAESAPKGPRTP